MKDPLLLEKAHILRNSKFFTNHVNGGKVSEKQAIFLTLAGLKPVSEGSSGHWEELPSGGKSIFDNPEEVRIFLESLGLQCQLRHDEYATDAVVSLREDLLNEYTKALELPEAQSYIAVGKLFGFPDTAVEAYAHYATGDEEAYLISNDEQDKIEREYGLDQGYFVNFRFSKAHWREELAICQDWHAVLQSYGLA